MDKEEIINKIQEAKERTREQMGAFKHDFAYDHAISIIEENVENEEEHNHDFELSYISKPEDGTVITEYAYLVCKKCGKVIKREVIYIK